MYSGLKGKKILIFGNSGFVGSWLCVALHFFGANILGVSLKMKNKNYLSNTSQFRKYIKTLNLIEGMFAFAVYDKYPVSEGHSLVVPIREINDLFELEQEEYLACFELVKKVRKILIDIMNNTIINDYGIPTFFTLKRVS